MSNGDLKSILMAISLLLLISAIMSAECIDGSNEAKSDERISNADNSVEVKLERFIPEISDMTVIQPYPVNGDGYSWSSDGLAVTITGGYEEYILSNIISKSITVHIDADEVTLDGNDVPITGIRGT